MSLAWYIVFEHRIPGFDHQVSGKLKNGRLLEQLTKKLVSHHSCNSLVHRKMICVHSTTRQSFRFADVLVGLVEGDAVGAEDGRRGKKH